MATCTHKFRSGRTYQQRICKNPNCMHGRNYIPHDARQEWCCTPCGVDANNDIRREKNRTKFLPEKQLRAYDKLLGKLYRKYVENEYCQVYKFIIQHEEIDISLCVQQETNLVTGKPIRWFYEFGLELHPEDNNFFIIHKKNNL